MKERANDEQRPRLSGKQLHGSFFLTSPHLLFWLVSSEGKPGKAILP